MRKPDKYEIIDTRNGNAVVEDFPTHRRALNRARKLEPRELPRGCSWRYLIRPAWNDRPATDRRAAS